MAPEHALAADGSDVAPGEPDPNFAEGLVRSIEGSLLRATGSGGEEHRIYLTGATSVWKLRPTTLDEIKVGDVLYARGVKLDDGTLAAEAVWVNIVSLAVHIRRFGRDVIHLEHHGKPMAGHVVPGTTTVVYQHGSPATADLSGLGIGEHAQVVGAWRPGTDEIDIATVYAAGRP